MPLDRRARSPCRWPSRHVGRRPGRRTSARVACAAMDIAGVAGLPEIRPGDDLAALIAAATDVVDGDVIVVTSKIVSKAEGRTVELDDVTPSGFAAEWSAKWDKDPRVVELVLRESRRIVRMVGP